MSGKGYRMMIIEALYSRSRRMYLVLVLVVISLTASACTYQLTEETLGIAPPASSPESEPAQPGTPQPVDVLTLPITIFILDDLDELRSSARTVDEMVDIFDKVNAIWAEAGIEIEVQGVHRVGVPSASIQAIADHQFGAFFAAVGRDFVLPDPSALNAFYVSEIGGPNGITPGGGIFFVADEPSVHDERVTSHEIGHILGLYHTLEDRGRLMYPGVNGMSLTSEEATVARYFAHRIVQDVQ